MSPDFKIAETETFQKKIISHKYDKLYEKIKDYIYPQLKKNPFFGPNIKRLKGPLADLYRYRIGDYRLFYKIDQNKIIIFIIDLIPRKDAYK